ncbi:MAG TPA: hypothetical protein VF543_04830 [Pyrinomonadaceae bacterium]
MKRTFIPLMLCAAFGLLLVACGGSDTNTNTTTSNTANTTTATSNKGSSANTTTTNTTTTNTTTTTSGSGEKIGVAECDEFIAKYDACVSAKVPESARAQYKSSLDQWRNSWKTLAANPATKGTLAAACKTTIEQARTSMKSYGCDF